MNKKIVFLSGTRADFGKIKPLITVLEKSNSYDVHVFVTGIHLMDKYGKTLIEIEKCGFSNIYTYSNHTEENTMDLTLSKTIHGFSSYIKNLAPHLIVVHGDRVEALAGAICGSLNNIRVAHIEGGEVSGTIDELIRHSVSKMSHIHYVSNEAAKNRLIQMGELESSIYTIGSPDIDIMFSDNLPDLSLVKRYYEIDFDSFAIVMFHPVTTEFNDMAKYAKQFVDALLLKSNKDNYVVIYPNNDMGSKSIFNEFERFKNNKRFKVFPSLRFEYFLSLLKSATYIIGNSSAGIREAPYYGVPTVNIGSRQNNRSNLAHIINVDYSSTSIDTGIKKCKNIEFQEITDNFGNGNSTQLFMNSLTGNPSIWEILNQKKFIDFKNDKR